LGILFFFAKNLKTKTELLKFALIAGRNLH